MPSYFVEFILTDNTTRQTGIVKLGNFSFHGSMAMPLTLRSGLTLIQNGGICSFTHTKDEITYNISVPIPEDNCLVTITLVTDYGKVGKPAVVVRRPGEFDFREYYARVEQLQQALENKKTWNESDECEELRQEAERLQKSADTHFVIALVLLFLFWPASIYFFWKRSQLEKQSHEIYQKIKNG